MRIEMYQLFAVSAFSLSFVADAAAHGAAPAATALLGFSGQEATFVQLTRGFAHRAAGAFRFVCPEVWGGDVLAPVAAIPGGPALVASEQLFVIQSDGSITPHADQPGTGIALANNRDSLFGLFERDGQQELRQITETSSQPVRSLEEPFRMLAASNNQLALLGWTGSKLVLQKVSLEGELGQRVEWNAPSTVSYAELRIAGPELYVLIWGSAAPWATLGRVTELGYEPLREANANIAGPITLAGGTLVALDGRLEILEDGTSVDTGGNFVTCLGSELGHPYACAHGDVLRVERDGLGWPLFEIASLHEPDYQGMPDAARQNCVTRWQDVSLDVAARLPASGATPDASAPDTPESTDSAAKPAGCTLGGKTEHPGWLGLIILLLLARRRRSAALA